MGLTFIEAAKESGIGKTMLRGWIGRYPELKDTMDEGRDRLWKTWMATTWGRHKATDKLFQLTLPHEVTTRRFGIGFCYP